MKGEVEALERKILPHLAAAATALRKRHSRLTINTQFSPTGSLTEYQGHDVGIDCMNPTTLDNEPSNVATPIGVKYLTTQSMLCDANVGWGVGGLTSCTSALVRKSAPEDRRSAA